MIFGYKNFEENELLTFSSFLIKLLLDIFNVLRAFFGSILGASEFQFILNLKIDV